MTFNTKYYTPAQRAPPG